MNYTIYYGTLPNGRRKIGVDEYYPSRINKQKLTDHHVMEVHTCIYEASEREIELQVLHDVEVDDVLYWKVSRTNKNIKKRAKVSATMMGNKNAAGNTSTKGSTLSEEHKAKTSATMTGVPKPKVQCPHCERTMSAANIQRHINSKHEEL